MTLSNPRFSAFERLRQAAVNHPPLRQNETGECVAAIQQALLDLGATMPRSTKNGTAMPDGIFGTETATKIKEFQIVNELVPDGIVGRQTLAQIELLIDRIHSASEQATRFELLKNKSAG